MLYLFDHSQRTTILRMTLEALYTSFIFKKGNLKGALLKTRLPKQIRLWNVPEYSRG